MASLIARTIAPRDRIDFFAACGERAARITERTRPAPRVPHGFYQMGGFVAACIAIGERNRFYRDACKQIAAREERRGRTWERNRA